MTEYFRIGKLVATHGFNGELVLKHSFGKKTSLKGLQTIFIEEPKNAFIPWFIQSTRIRNEEEVILKFEGVDTKEAAAKLKTKEAWVTKADRDRFTAKTAPMKLVGYVLVENQKHIGKILETIEQPHQLLCRIEINNKEALVPLNVNTLKKIDHKKQEVVVELPEGLLDVYL